MPLRAFSFLHKLRHQWTFSEKNISGFPRCFWTQSTHIISESNNHHSREWWTPKQLWTELNNCSL